MSKNRNGRKKVFEEKNEKVIPKWKIRGKCPEVDTGQYYKTTQRSQKD